LPTSIEVIFILLAQTTKFRCRLSQGHPTTATTPSTATTICRAARCRSSSSAITIGDERRRGCNSLERNSLLLHAVVHGVCKQMRERVHTIHEGGARGGEKGGGGGRGRWRGRGGGGGGGGERDGEGGKEWEREGEGDDSMVSGIQPRRCVSVQA
jgi:hypothetical protein